METRQIKYFLAISKFGSFTAAAKGIGVAQPALSAQIAKLEAEFGGLLFVRHKRGIELTVMGERFKDHAIDIWERMEVARQVSRLAALTATCEVTIGIPPLISMLLVAPLIQAVQSSLQNVVLRVREAMTVALREMLAAREVDLALLYTAPGECLANAEPMFEEQLYLGSRATAEIRVPAGISAEQLSSIPLILSTPSTSHRQLLEDFSRRTGTRLNVVAEVDSITGQRDLVLKGVGATVLPLSGYLAWPQAGLRIVPLNCAGLVSKASLVRSAGPLDVRTLAPLRGLLHRVIQGLIETGQWPGASIASVPVHESVFQSDGLARPIGNRPRSTIAH
jgi:LysR family nitrogen assimilation transcriptional regulator